MEFKFTQKPLFAFVLALVGVVMFSSKAVMVKMAYNYSIDAVSLLMLRLMFSLPVYIIILLLSIKKLRQKALPVKDYLTIVFFGFLGYYLASYLDFVGLKYVSASLERLILFIYPTLVLILSAIFLGKRATLAQKIAVLVTYAGVGMAFIKTNMESENLILGAVLIFFCALSYAAYLVGCGKLIPKFGAAQFTSIAMIVSTLSALVHYLVENGANFTEYPAEVFVLSLAMAVISTLIPSFLLAEAIRRIGSTNVAIVGSFGPISTIILAMIFIGEIITLYQIIGTFVVVVGIMIIGIKKQNIKAIKQWFFKRKLRDCLNFIF